MADDTKKADTKNTKKVNFLKSKFIDGTITLKKTTFICLMFVGLVFACLMIVFAVLRGQTTKQLLDATNGYSMLAGQINSLNGTVDSLNLKIAEQNKEATVKDIRIELVNAERAEQAELNKEYIEIINTLKVQLALRGIETGDFEALEAISTDFAKQYEEIKKREAEALAAEVVVGGANTTSKADDNAEEPTGLDGWGSSLVNALGN